MDYPLISSIIFDRYVNGFTSYVKLWENGIDTRFSLLYDYKGYDDKVYIFL